MQYKGREKAAKVVEFVAKWLNLCLSTVLVWWQLDIKMSAWKKRSMIVCSIWRVKIALFFRFCLESSFLSFFSEWVKVGLFFSKDVSSDSSIFPSLWFLTGKEWYRGRVCWVGFKLSLLYFPLPMVPYGAGVTEGPHLLGGFWVKFALSQFRFLYLPLSQFIKVGFQLSLLYLRFWVKFALSLLRFLHLPL